MTMNAKGRAECLQHIRGEDVASERGRLNDSQWTRNTFWRRSEWSPDGTHLLAQSDDHHLDLFRLDVDPSKELRHCLSILAPSTLLSFAWYPFARFDDPSTWCFAMSSKDVPVRLVDAYQGSTRATYGILDHTERLVGPQALAFDLHGTKLHCGYSGLVHTFELSRPGINTFVRTLRLKSSRRARGQNAVDGQCGAISFLAVGEDSIAGSGEELLAVGTFAGSVGLYRSAQLESCMGDKFCLLGWRENDCQGISQILFHPTSPHILFVSSRRSVNIYAYDLRYAGISCSFLQPLPDIALLAIFDRFDSSPVKTQQHLYFDIGPVGRFLVAGDQRGFVRMWDVCQSEKGAEKQPETSLHQAHNFGCILRQDQDPRREPVARWRVARDAIPSSTIHPYDPIIVFASGSRTWSDSVLADGEARQSYDSSAPYSVSDGSLYMYQIGSFL